MMFGLLLWISVCTNVSAQEQKEAQYHVTKITDHAYVITQIWSGQNNGNMGVVIGNEGVLLINTLMSNSVKQLHAQIKKLTDKPIKYVINSDSDPYNHNANRYFAELGATIYSHQNFKYTNSFHQVLFSQKLTLNLGNETVTAHHTPAHTFDHALIHLKEANVVFIADAFKAHWIAPIGANGIKGYNTAVDLALSLSDKNTVIVTGNTSKKPERFVLDRNALIKVKAIQNRFESRVGELYQLGLSLDKMAEDKQLQQILMPLEKFDSFYQYIRASINASIETNFITPYALTEQQLSNYVGRYMPTEHGAMEIKLINNRLYVMEVGRYMYELSPLSATKFDFKANSKVDHLLFSIDSQGKVTGLEVVMDKQSWWRHALPSGKRTKL